MKVNKLSKHKNTKKNKKLNNKTNKRINKTQKRINRLKGGDDNKQRLINFINSLPNNKDESKETNKDEIKLLTYFNIKIILLYIVAYRLLDENNLEQIFIWFSSNQKTNPFIMKLLTDDIIKNRLLTLIYEKINNVFSSQSNNNKSNTTPTQFKFEFNTHLQYNETFNEHTEFIKYLNSDKYEQYTQTQINMTKPIRNQSKKIPVMPIADKLTTLLGETNYLHFMANYLQFFDEKGHLRVKTNIIYDLKYTTPTSKILKNDNNITVKECSNLINSQIPFKQINNNNSPAILSLSNTKKIKKVSNTNTNTITHYSCFVKNTKLLINYSNISSSNK